MTLSENFDFGWKDDVSYNDSPSHNGHRNCWKGIFILVVLHLRRSAPVGCPGFCWLIDFVWPFVMLWKSIQRNFFFLLHHPHLNLFGFCHILSSERRQIKHLRHARTICEFREISNFICLFVSRSPWGCWKRKYLFAWFVSYQILDNFLSFEEKEKLCNLCVGLNWI